MYCLKQKKKKKKKESYFLISIKFVQNFVSGNFNSKDCDVDIFILI